MGTLQNKKVISGHNLARVKKKLNCIEYFQKKQDAKNVGFHAGLNGLPLPTEPREFDYQIRCGFREGKIEFANRQAIKNPPF